MTSENKLLLAKLNDMTHLSEKYQGPVFSSFLDGAQLAFIRDSFFCPMWCRLVLYGGFDDAERKMAGVFPDWYEQSYDDFPITVLNITGGFKRRLSHRDYLGAMMSLGIKRDKTGDILVYDGGAYVFIAKDIALFAKTNITKVANEGVKVTETDFREIRIPERQKERIETVCASLRTDAVVAAALGISRKEAAELVSGGMVRINYREVSDGSKNIADKDLISVRGFGRFLFDGVLGVTRKERLHIVLYKYI